MVHQYQLNGYNIVLDSCSGSVHVVDDVAYDVIAMYKEHSADEIVAAMLAKVCRPPRSTEADLRQCLEDAGLVWKPAGKPVGAPDAYADMAFDFKNRQTLWSRRCACTWPTPATSTAPTASPRRAAIRATAP